MKKQYALIALSVLLLTGCVIRFAYNQLDWIIPWHIDGLISLNSDQETELEKKLLAQLKWHRATHLSKYAKSIEELSSAVKTDLSIEHLDKFHLTMRSYWKDLVSHICPDIAPILSRATDEQVDELLNNLSERNKKHIEKHINLSEKKYREKMRNRLIRFLEFFMDDLNDNQNEIVVKWSLSVKNIGHARLEYIELRQEKFKEIIKKRKEVQWFEKELCELLNFKRENWSKELKEIARYNRELTKKVLLQIHKCMTQDQKNDFFENAMSIADVFHELAKEI